VTSFEVRRIDPADEAALREWWVTGREASAERAEPSWRPWEAIRDAAQRPNPEYGLTMLGGYGADGSMLGCASLDSPQLENTHLGMGQVLVPRRHRRGGVGTALLTELETILGTDGRTHLLIEVATPPDEESDGSRFGRARGYDVANVETSRLVDLAATAVLHEQLGAAEASRDDGYQIVSFSDETPEEYVEPLCRLLTDFMNHIPLGDVAMQAGEWTPERLRRNEQRRRELDRQAFVALAIAPDGTVVGTSDLRLDLPDPAAASIGITMVEPAHRGHGLGLAMKLATHRDLRAAHPGCGQVRTSNADTNAHMIAVNERLGYRPVERLLDLQKVL